MHIFRIAKKLLFMLRDRQGISLGGLFALMLIGGLLEIASVSLIIPYIKAVMNPDDIMKNKYVGLICSSWGIADSKTFLMITACVLGCIYIFKSLYLLLEYHIQYKFVYNNMVITQKKVLSGYLHKPYEFYMSANSGEIIRIINTDISISYNLLLSVLTLCTESIVSFMLVIALFIIAPYITMCISFALFFLLLLMVNFIRPIVRKAGKEHQAAVAGMNQCVIQSVNGIKEIKMLGKEKYFCEQFERNGKHFAFAIRKNQILNMSPRILLEGLVVSIMFAVIAFLIASGSKIENVAPALSAVAMTAIKLLPAASKISSGLSSAAYAEPMLDKVVESLNSIDEYLEVNHLNDNYEHITLNNSIILENITYRYPGTNKDVICDGCLEIKRGESVGFVGESGSGKTTTVDIICGLLSPKSGRILVDGIDVENEIGAWQREIGYIPQNIFLIDGTIKENIVMGESETDEERVWKALEEASLSEFVKSLPDGMDSRVGERGVRLSGGQKQRIGIARTLYRNPSVLIFDEATSALDTETETSIIDSIYNLRGNKTLIMIAHRLSTLEKCDAIYRVSNGKIIRER